MNDKEPNQEDLEALREYDQTALAKALLERLSPEDAGFVFRCLTERGICRNCFEEGPYCCYDSQPEFD